VIKPSNARFHYFGDSRWRFVKSLFRQWHRLLSDFEKVIHAKGYDNLPYRESERTNAGVLAAAATLMTDTVALEEYPVKRRGQDVGRADLWVCDKRGNRSYDFEFKMLWRSLRSTRTGNLRRALAAASRDVRRLPRPGDPSWGVALVFLVPSLERAPRHAAESEQLWRSFIDTLSSPRSLGADFVVIHKAYPGVAEKLAARSKDAFLPGVAAVGRRVAYRRR